MNNNHNYFDELPWESTTNPFAIPRTVPGGWDLSELRDLPSAVDLLAAQKTGGSPDRLPAESVTGCQADKFGEPRTIPAFWDTSAFVGHL